MYKSEARLFGMAVVAGLSNRYEKELAENTESPRCSEVQTSAILDIVSKASIHCQTKGGTNGQKY